MCGVGEGGGSISKVKKTSSKMRYIYNVDKNTFFMYWFSIEHYNMCLYLGELMIRSSILFTGQWVYNCRS